MLPTMTGRASSRSLVDVVGLGLSSSVEALREAIELRAEHWNDATRSTPHRTTTARTRRTARMSQVELRPVEDGDLDAIFEQMRDPESVPMAAFTAKDPDDRSAFDAHMAKILSSP